MEQPFVTLIAERFPVDPEIYMQDSLPLLHVTFLEETYDATCLAIQTLADALPSLFAGDPVRVQFVHRDATYSDKWEGVMPSSYEAKHPPADRDNAAWSWREFIDSVYQGTRA